MDDEVGEREAVIALVRAGRVLDPLGRSGDELADEHRDALAAAKGAHVGRASFGMLRSGALGRMLAAELESPSGPLPAELAELEADDEFARRMRGLELQSARVEGERRALMAASVQRAVDACRADGGDSGIAVRELASLAAVELGLSVRGMERRMNDAWELVTELPAAHEAAAAGRITIAHLRVIEGETRAVRRDPAVDEQQRARVVDELVAVAETTTPGRVRRRAKRIVDAVLTVPLQQRHDAARELRSVELFDAGDGMSDLVLHVPSVLGAGILDRVTQAARAKPKDDPRTFDQFRADALCELLLAGTVADDLHRTSPITAHVSVLIPATMLTDEPGSSGQPFPASLDGRVLVDPDTARRLARGATIWERLFTDPVTGVAVTADTYRPPAELKRYLLARDGGCRFPGCTASALRADLDHTQDWAKGGATTPDNLATLCRSDHTFKHASGWSVRQLGHGVLEWTTPLGRVIIDEPEPVGPRFTDRSSWPDASSGSGPPGDDFPW